jgi:ribosomal protein S18 acetylase RimI-like enzyme
MVTIEQLTAEQAEARTSELVHVLRDTVDAGASIGFLPPLSDEDARGYWAGIIAELARSMRLLLAATQHGQIVGAVQLELATKPNALHRAEVQKLMVHTQARRQGIGLALMSAVEDAARAAGRTLLVLDTRQGDPAEQFYARFGYTRVGSIPEYARSSNGALDATVIFYKLL